MLPGFFGLNTLDIDDNNPGFFVTEVAVAISSCAVLVLADAADCVLIAYIGSVLADVTDTCFFDEPFFLFELALFWSAAAELLLFSFSKRLSSSAIR